MSERQNLRKIKIFRYDPEKGGDGHFDEYVLNVPDENTTTILDVLLRVQREQDPTLAFRYACRVNMCGSCGMVINGTEGLACKTNVSHVPAGREITIRPLNHFPIIKDLVVDMGPFFDKFAKVLPFYEPSMEYAEPAVIPPDTKEREDIGMDTDCIWCGCCVSSCDMVSYRQDYAGPAPLTRAFTLLRDSRDGLFMERLERAVESCYHCRTEFNCTEVCPKQISGTRAIKFIQRLAAQHLSGKRNPPQEFAENSPAAPCSAEAASCSAKDSPCASSPTETASASAASASNAQAERSRNRVATPPPSSSSGAAGDTCAMNRRSFLGNAAVGIVGVGTALVLGGLGLQTLVAPTLAKSEKTWVPLLKLSDLPKGAITTASLRYERKDGPYTQEVISTVLVSTLGEEIVCFNSSCTHLGCVVKWDEAGDRFRCACHGGTFDKTGAVLDGPPPRPLDRYATKISGDFLLVEVG